MTRNVKQNDRVIIQPDFMTHPRIDIPDCRPENFLQKTLWTRLVQETRNSCSVATATLRSIQYVCQKSWNVSYYCTVLFYIITRNSYNAAYCVVIYQGSQGPNTLRTPGKEDTVEVLIILVLIKPVHKLQLVHGKLVPMCTVGWLCISHYQKKASSFSQPCYNQNGT